MRAVLKTASALLAIILVTRFFLDHEEPKSVRARAVKKPAARVAGASRPQPVAARPVTAPVKREAKAEFQSEAGENLPPKEKINFAEELDLSAELARDPRAPIPDGRVSFQIPSPDGSFGVVEEFLDGPLVHRYIAADGGLIGESVQFENGDRVDRMYDHSGYIKGTAVSRADGTRTDTTYSAEGFVTGESRHFYDGLRTVTKYDGGGRPVEKWRSWDGERWELFN